MSFKFDINAQKYLLLQLQPLFDTFDSGEAHRKYVERERLLRTIKVFSWTHMGMFHGMHDNHSATSALQKLLQPPVG